MVDALPKRRYNTYIQTHKGAKMIAEDLKVIEGIKARLNTGMLETMVYIDANSEEFTLAELRAYFRVKAQFQKLFEPA
jgi:hypothetical protein